MPDSEIEILNAIQEMLRKSAVLHEEFIDPKTTDKRKFEISMEFFQLQKDRLGLRKDLQALKRKL